ncbi:MAG TPA: ABC transporter ATP-binding protein [Bryobacteraceae bacterium]|jgi:NitT/TauT family transport system ATP-binding protein
MKLRCEGLEVSYATNGSRDRVLHRISLETGPGEFLTILGPSGCGKTTFLRTVTGAIRPDRGRIQLLPEFPGESVHPLLIRQEHALFPWLTAMDNACFGLAMQRVPRPERERRAAELFVRYGLQGRERAWPHQLSLGMKQRVALIRGFLSDPPMLLMDEPFAALDVPSRLMLQQELIAQWESREHVAVIFVTHDVEEALLLSDRVLIFSGRPASVLAEIPVHLVRPRTAAVTLAPEFLELKARILEYLGVALEGAPLRV